MSKSGRLSVRTKGASTARHPAGAVVLLGNYRPTLVLARHLKAKGYHVICGLEGCDRGAELSLSVDELWDHPALDAPEDGFQQALNALLAAREDIACLFPVAEEYVRAFANAPPVLPAHVTLAMVAGQTVLTCLDKKAMLAHAHSADVPIAPYAYVRTHGALVEQADQIGFPLVVRPQASTERLAGQKALMIDSAEALQQVLPCWPDKQPGLLLQKKASGIRHNIYFAALNGQMCRGLHAVITRTDRPDGSGLAVDGVTVSADPALLRHTSALLQRLQYSGVGCAQFLVDEATGAICFLEINARIAGNHALADYCGLELEDFLIAVSQGDLTNPIVQPKIPVARQVRYGWLAGDIEGFKSCLKRGELSWRSAVQWIGRLVRTSWQSDLDMMLSWRDPLPGLVTLFDTIPLIGHLTRCRHRWPLLTLKRRLVVQPTQTDRTPALQAKQGSA